MNDILKIIDERKQIYLDWLAQLCRQPSIAAQNVGMEAAAALVEKLLQEIGAQTRQISTGGFPVVYGEIGAGEKTLSFYDHYDVQPPEPLEEWTSDPFAPDIRDGVFYARGVSDNKGNLIARIAAVDAYLRARGQLPERVKFIFEGEEEIGSPHLSEFAQGHPDLAQADACIWEAGYKDPQGRPEIYLGVKGMLYVQLTARAANVDLHSMWASIVPNAAWHLLRALQTLKDANERVLIPGFYDNMQPPSPLDLAALEQMPFDAGSFLSLLELDSFTDRVTGQPLLQQHIFQPTCNICGIWSGYTGQGSKTVLPHRASAKLDFRLVPNQDPDQIFDLLAAHLRNSGFGDIQLERLGNLHPARTPIDHPFVELVVDSARDIYQTEPVIYPIVPGSGPMYELCQRLNIPAVSIGVGNADSRNHAPNENIRLEDFYQGIAHVASILDRFPLLEVKQS